MRDVAVWTSQKDCCSLPDRGGNARRASKGDRTFRTMTEDLWSCRIGWRRVYAMAMESTGVYWKPIYNLLEEAPAFGQRPAHQGGPGAQDRRQGLRVDRRSAQALQPIAEQLRARTTPRELGTGPLPDGPGAGACSRGK